MRAGRPSGDAVPGKSISKILFALSVLRGVPRLRVTLDPSAPRIRSLVGARTSDLVVAAIGLFFFLPALLLIALLIRVAAGPGPILYRSWRVGPKGETLMLFAFRTNFARPVGDRRAPTRFAAGLSSLLRASGVYVLPRMLNVLRGDLSLVGPPPAFPSAPYIELIEHAKAGMVSWSVLIADEEEARRRDLAYHVSWSPAKFFEAMWRTMLETFRGQPGSGGR